MRERTEVGSRQVRPVDYQSLRARWTSQTWPGGGHTELVGVLSQALSGTVARLAAWTSTTPSGSSVM